MKCPKCAFSNDGQSRTCAQCGEPLDATPLIRDITPIAAYPADLVLGPGDDFGSRYQIIEQIGVGGMGRVFKALDKDLGIVVVLKIIKSEMNDSAEAVERFKRELLLAREIIHENVIRIYDLGEMNGIRYISMNYVEGQNLQELIAMAGPLEVGKVLDVIGKVCRGLIAAHGKGIIHRDLKPQNVMIGKNGMVTVLDFGIARSMNQVGTTRTGIVIGTPECMAPEQIQGEKIDASTDIYSLGVMMFQMLTGRVPFLADSMQSLLLKHLHESPIPPSSINPAIPRALERIILKCLKKRPDKRYASAEKLLEKIENLLKKKARQEKSKRVLLPLLRPLRWRPAVYLGRFLELVVLLFVCATVLVWIVDGHYGGKLLGLTAEYPLYFKTRFPLDKDYLPADWPARQGDAWKRYRRAAQAQAALPSGAAGRLGHEIEKLRHAAIPPAGVDAVAGVLASAGEKMGMDDVLAAIASNTLAPKAGEALPAEFITTFSRWQALKARLEFLRGNNAGGVERLRELGYFLVDCEATAGTMTDYAQAAAQFPIFCQEVVLLALADDIDPAKKQLERIEPLLLTLLKKTGDKRFFQLAYLDDLQAARQGDFSESWWTGPAYFWFGKFRFMAGRSTRNFFLWRTLSAESRARESLSSNPPQQEIRGLLDRFRHSDGMEWPRIGSHRFYRLHGSLRADRTLVKLALLLERLQRFGMNANEVVSLLVSDLGKNELTGEPWKIIQAPDKIVIRVTGQAEFTVRPINYASDHAVVIAEWEKIAAAIGATNNPGK
jgi:hypothetical protein